MGHIHAVVVWAKDMRRRNRIMYRTENHICFRKDGYPNIMCAREIHILKLIRKRYFSIYSKRVNKVGK